MSQPLVPSKVCTLKHIDITFQYEQKFDDLQCVNSKEEETDIHQWRTMLFQLKHLP